MFGKVYSTLAASKFIRMMFWNVLEAPPFNETYAFAIFWYVAPLAVSYGCRSVGTVPFLLVAFLLEPGAPEKLTREPKDAKPEEKQR